MLRKPLCAIAASVAVAFTAVSSVEAQSCVRFEYLTNQWLQEGKAFDAFISPPIGEHVALFRDADGWYAVYVQEGSMCVVGWVSGTGIAVFKTGFFDDLYPDATEEEVE